MPRKPVEFCCRGHRVSGANHKTKIRGKGCRACECAISQAWNEEHRKGTVWRPEDVQAYADLKFEEFSREGL